MSWRQNSRFNWIIQIHIIEGLCTWSKNNNHFNISLYIFSHVKNTKTNEINRKMARGILLSSKRPHSNLCSLLRNGNIFTNGSLLRVIALKIWQKIHLPSIFKEKKIQIEKIPIGDHFPPYSLRNKTSIEYSVASILSGFFSLYTNIKN